MEGRTVKPAKVESPPAVKAWIWSFISAFSTAFRIDKLSKAAMAQGLRNWDFEWTTKPVEEKQNDCSLCKSHKVCDALPIISSEMNIYSMWCRK